MSIQLQTNENFALAQRLMSKCKILIPDPETGSFDKEKYKEINVLWDTGTSFKDPSTNKLIEAGTPCNLIRFEVAEELGYKGERAMIECETQYEDNDTNKRGEVVNQYNSTYLYKVNIMDRQGTIHKIQAYGFQDISRDQIPLKRSAIKLYARKFRVADSQISNIGGSADMLIGYKQQGTYEADQKHLLPKNINWKENKKGDFSNAKGLYETDFGEKRYLLSGSFCRHEKIEDEDETPQKYLPATWEHVPNHPQDIR